MYKQLMSAERCADYLTVFVGSQWDEEGEFPAGFREFLQQEVAPHYAHYHAVYKHWYEALYSQLISALTLAWTATVEKRRAVHGEPENVIRGILLAALYHHTQAVEFDKPSPLDEAAINTIRVSFAPDVPLPVGYYRTPQEAYDDYATGKIKESAFNSYLKWYRGRGV